MPSLLLFCVFIVAVALHWMIGRWANHPVLTVLGVATWMTWSLVCYLGMSLACVRSLRSVRLLGLRSILRPRIWFELAHVAWNLAAIGICASMSIAFAGLGLNLKPLEVVAWSAAKTMLAYLPLVIASTGCIGYALAVARWRLPAGRAVECVNAFLPFGAGMYLIAQAFGGRPLLAVWPDVLIATVFGVGGCALLLAGFKFTLERAEARLARGGQLAPASATSGLASRAGTEMPHVP